MAHGKTLEMKAIKRPAPELFQRGNPDHYHAKPEPIRVHKRTPPSLGLRPRYRAIVRREREEAAQAKNRERLARSYKDVIPAGHPAREALENQSKREDLVERPVRR